MNPISKATSVILHPVRTATALAGRSVGLAAAGARQTMRLIDWAAGQGREDGATVGATGGAAASQAEATAQAPSARAATVAPALSVPAAEVTEEDDLRTPSGIPAADEGHNPDTTDTDLHQPGTEPLMDPATVKAIKSESDVMQRAADTKKG